MQGGAAARTPVPRSEKPETVGRPSLAFKGRSSTGQREVAQSLDPGFVLNFVRSCVRELGLGVRQIIPSPSSAAEKQLTLRLISQIDIRDIQSTILLRPATRGLQAHIRERQVARMIHTVRQ